MPPRSMPTHSRAVRPRRAARGCLWAAPRHRWRFVVAWIVVAVAVLAWNHAAGGRTRDVFTIPGSETQKALDLLEEDFPQASGDTATVVFAVSSGKVSDSGPSQGI